MIILSIVLLVALYYLYKFLLGGTNGANIMRIASMPQTPAYDIKSNTNPGSYRYSYAIWVHVKNLGNNTLTSTYGNNNPANNIMYLKDKNGSSPYTFFSLDLYGDTSMYVRYNQPTAQNPTAILGQPYLVTPNFPLQKWTLIIVSFDNMYMDLYLNGKFVKSVQFNNATGINTLGIPVQTSTSTNIVFGEMGDNKSSPDIDVRLFERYEYSMDPQTAWNKYKSDKNVSDGTSTNYGLKFNLFTNNKLQSYPIF
jgi:hypothetical protein